MTAVEAKSTPDTYFINGKNLAGATGVLYGRVASTEALAGLIPLERLAVRMTMPASHHGELHGYFERRELFSFEIHRGMQVRLSVVAVVAELEKKDMSASCLVEFEVL